MKVILSALFMLCMLTGCKDNTPETLQSDPKANASSSKSRIVDLTYDFSDETIYWVTSKEFELEVVAKGHTEGGYFYAANNFSTAEHGGTHVDAPIHFAEKGESVDKIPLERLVAPAVKVDVSARAMNDPDYLISIEDLTNWEAREGMEIPDGSILLLQTGFGSFYPDKEKYLGTANRGPEAIKDLHFPGLSPEAAEWLVNNRNISAVGLDTPSIDYGQSTDFRSHVILMTDNIPAFENVANLDQLPSKGFQVIALPMKIKDGSGAPLRIIAILND